MKKKLGILGGMGPLASKVFYERITNNTLAASDNDHIDIMLLSHASIPDRTKVILENRDHSEIIDPVRKDIRAFESYGVENIAVACNTFHYFLEEVEKLTSISFINMIDLASFDAKKLGNKVTVLGTTGTLQTGIYDKYIKKYGLDQLKVDDQIAKKLMDTIYHIKATNDTNFKDFNEICRYYLDKGSVPLIACTELSTINLEKDIEDKVVDALSVLTRECILRSGYKLKYKKIIH
ncbi:aspartate/glutamate racemase family protein [Neofamilia massiliensis]|uniref:aspartate/glutamate racemase family protein n=1 Tax=Neofamilia massiliensis TaxID=1673724 RepID=UPI00096AD135|nr:amino acid racemase [Neofamilia massiliensis]